MVKTEKRQLHADVDGVRKAADDRQGGWEEWLCRLAFGGLEVVR